ncbi:MAG TPA: hypothetical protein VKB38_12415, partial [Terracidiphilus sp.]|nr:hypothetical protein [Terracidiphilus sp.]
GNAHNWFGNLGRSRAMCGATSRRSNAEPLESALSWTFSLLAGDYCHTLAPAVQARIKLGRTKLALNFGIRSVSID